MPVNPYHVRLAISQYGEQFRAELFTEDLGDTDGDLLPADWQQQFDRWMDYLQGGGELRPGADAEVGGQLFEWVFGRGANRGKWDEILGHVAGQPGRPLRLLIDTAAAGTAAAPDRDRDRIHNLPYGLLFDPRHSYFLFRPGAGRPPIQFVRIIRRCTPRPLNLHPESKPVRLLLAAAEPDSPDVPPFGCAGRLRQLAAGLAHMPAAFEPFLCTPGGARALGEAAPGAPPGWTDELFAPVSKATRAALAGALAGGNFDVLHLLAHGRDNGVLLCAADGREDPVSALDLKEWCGRSRLQMAFLQVCWAGRTGGRGAFGGLAQELLNPKGGDLAAVVASPYPLEAAASTEAALLFYRRLAEGRSPDEALRRDLDESNWAWALLELWVRPRALEGTGARGAYQFVSPYRGLASFQERDADVFCGRDAEVAELLQLLRGEAVVAVVGDSGSGKSSLLQAGLAHSVRQTGLPAGPGRRRAGWRLVSLRPGAEPAQALWRALLATEDDGGAAALPEPADWAPALTALLEASCGPAHPLLLIFDQFEEAFTLGRDDAQRRAVAEALAQVAESRPDDFRLVLGVRGDHAPRTASLPGLTRFVTRPWVLKPPGPERLADVVGRPARAYGYTFEGSSDGPPADRSGLRERILDDPLLAAGGAGAPADAPLALLEFALERLWLKAVGRGSSQFTHADYDALGGLGGAIARHADDVYERLGAPARSLAEAIFTALVTSRGTRRPRRRGELEEQVAPDGAGRAEASRVIDHLVGERLLTLRSDPDRPGEAVVEIAHEVLLQHWGRVKEWLSHEREGRALREAFERDHERWRAGIAGVPPRSRRGLPSADTTVVYVAWIDKARPNLRAAEEEFAQQLRRQLRRRRWLFGIVVGVSVGVVQVMATLTWDAREQRQQAQTNETSARNAQHLAQISEGKAKGALKETERQLVLNYLQGGVAECERGRPDVGLLWLLRGYEMAPKDDPLRLGVRHLLAGWSRSQGISLISGSGVYAVTFSPSGKTVLTGGFDGMARLWDAATGRPRGQPLRHGGPVVAVAFSPDGKTILTGSADKTARLWDFITGQQRGWPFRHGGGVQAVAFSPDGKTFLTGSAEGTAQLWDAATGAARGQTLRHGGAVRSVAFSPDGKAVLTGSADKTARLWDAATGLPRGPSLRHGEDVGPVAFSPDGKTVLTGSADKSARLWDAATGRPRGQPLRHGGAVPAVAFSPDGKAVLTGSADETARLWDATTGLPRGQPLPHGNRVNAVGFSPDGLTVLTGSDDRMARLWDVATGRPLGQPLAHEGIVVAVAFSPDGQTILTGCSNVAARLWHAATGQPRGLPIPPENPVFAMAFSPDGATVLTGGWDKTAQLWDAATGRPRGQPFPHGSVIWATVFSPDGKTVLTGGEDKIARLWDAATGQPRGQPLRHEGAVHTVAISSDGNTVLTGSGDKTAQPWDTATGQPRGQPLQFGGAITVVAISPDGKIALTGGSNKAWLWDTVTSQPRGRPLLHDGEIVAAAFSPDGSTVLTASADRTARLWDAATGESRGQPLQHAGSVEAVAFGPDGQTALTGSADRTARLWDVASCQPCGPALPHADGVRAVAFSPDGRTAFTGGKDAVVRQWDVAPIVPDETDIVRLWIEVLTLKCWDEQGQLRFLSPKEWSDRRERLDELGGPPIPLHGR
jgi:WD40 repeat protein